MSFYGIEAPCKDCSERHLGCHSECDKYIDYRAQADEMKKKILMESANRAYMVDKVINTVNEKRYGKLKPSKIFHNHKK